MPQADKNFFVDLARTFGGAIQCVHQVGHLDAWRDKQISLNDYNNRNGKGLKKETVAGILSAE